jgi:hypothetical protein
MLRDIDANELGKLFTDGMQDNSTRAEFGKAIPGTLRMAELFAAKKRLVAGDNFSVDFTPGVGTVVLINGKASGTSRSGAGVLHRADEDLARAEPCRLAAQGRPAGPAQGLSPGTLGTSAGGLRPAAGQLVDAVDPAVGVDALDRLAVVVAIAHQHHGAAGCARGQGVVGRVAHHQRAPRRAAQGFAGAQQRQRVGLAALEAVAAEHMPEAQRASSARIASITAL